MFTKCLHSCHCIDYKSASNHAVQGLPLKAALVINLPIQLYNLANDSTSSHYLEFRNNNTIIKVPHSRYSKGTKGAYTLVARLSIEKSLHKLQSMITKHYRTRSANSDLHDETQEVPL